MASFTAVAVIILICLFPPPAAPQTSDSLLSQLSALQSNSTSGIIRLTDDLLRRITSLPTPRPFHAIIFFDASHLHSNPELSLPTLKKEFALVSSAFQNNNPNPNQNSQLLFFDIDFHQSQASFAVFGVNSLPHVRLMPPAAVQLKSDSIKMPTASRFAESLVEFIESETGFSVGPVNRPPFVSRTQIVFLVTLLLISIPIFIKRLMSGNTFLHEKGIWMAGSIFVYFFSVSGGMFNIIRKAPLFLSDRNDPSKLVFFYQGSGMQLGAEGFAVGSLYTIVGLLLAFAIHGMVGVRSITLQRWLMIFAMFVSFWAVNKVIFLDNWKTGYSVHWYWPSSWR